MMTEIAPCVNSHEWRGNHLQLTRTCIYIDYVRLSSSTCIGIGFA